MLIGWLMPIVNCVKSQLGFLPCRDSRYRHGQAGTQLFQARRCWAKFGDMKTGMLSTQHITGGASHTEPTLVQVTEVAFEKSTQGENNTQSHASTIMESQAMARLALTHTAVEHKLYVVMLIEVLAAHTRVCTFSIRELMSLAQLPNYSAIRRGLNGLIAKLSIERHKIAGSDGPQQETVFLVFMPEEVFARRTAAQFAVKQREPELLPEGHSFDQAIHHLAERFDLSRREAQVALCCAQGLSNTEIGERLFISEQTVKFHLRHIFVKYGVRRRAELIARLLSPDK